jgi:cell division protein FtsQ
MSSDYVFAEETSSRPIQNSSGMNKGLKRVILVVSIVLAAELFWLFGISPMMPLSVVEVTGMPGADRAMILSQAGITPRSSYFTVNTAEMEKALGSLYQVESVRVTKRFPDTVRIVLEPSQAVAMSLAAFNGRIYPIFLDKHGVIIKIGDDKQGMASSMPIISGLVFDQPVLGMKLPAMFASFFDNLDRINAAAPELMGTISEIRINRKTYDGFDLILYPVHNPIRVRVGADLNEETLRYMMLMIDVLRGANVGEVDFRTGTASYTLKEASSG